MTTSLIRNKETLPTFADQEYRADKLRQLTAILERRLHAIEDILTDANGVPGPPGSPGGPGPPGAPGADGSDGIGVPAGGLTGEVLAKASNADYDTDWVASGGAAASDRVWNFFMSR